MKRLLPYLLIFVAVNAHASGLNRKQTFPTFSADNTVLALDASFPGGLKWTAQGSGGAATTPGGSDTQVQFNDGGSFGGDTGLTFNKTTNTLSADNLTLATDLPVAQGGTGAGTLTDGGVLIGKGTSAIENTGVLALGTLIVGDGATNPTTLTAGANGTVLSADNSTASGLNWVTATNINPSRAKGSIDTFGSTNMALLVGSDGQVLSADSSTTTGLKWVTLPASGASPLTTKGDIYTYAAADDRLGVGTNGQVLSADSATTTGLRWVGVVQHKTYINFPVHSTKLSADTAVRIDGGFYLWRLLFADGVSGNDKNLCLWQGRMDDNWQGGALTAKIDYHMTSSDSTSTAAGAVTFGVSIMAITSGDATAMLTKSFDTENSKTQEVPAVVSTDATVTIPLTSLDGLAAGDWYIVRLRRDGADTITGDSAVTSFAITQ